MKAQQNSGLGCVRPEKERMAQIELEPCCSRAKAAPPPLPTSLVATQTSFYRGGQAASLAINPAAGGACSQGAPATWCPAHLGNDAGRRDGVALAVPLDDGPAPLRVKCLHGPPRRDTCHLVPIVAALVHAKKTRALNLGTCGHMFLPTRSAECCKTRQNKTTVQCGACHCVPVPTAASQCVAPRPAASMARRPAPCMGNACPGGPATAAPATAAP